MLEKKKKKLYNYIIKESYKHFQASKSMKVALVTSMLKCVYLNYFVMATVAGIIFSISL